MASNTFLRITDGATTITFADGAGGDTDYRVEEDGWAPAMGGLRGSELSGRGPYGEVVEEFTCLVKGVSAAACMANIRNLTNLLERADRWVRDETPAAVEIRYSPKGATDSSDTSPLRAVILGKVPGDSIAVTLPPDFELMAGTNFKVPGIRVRFHRQGDWKQHVEVTASSTATNNGSIATMTPGAINVPSATRFDITNFVTVEDTANNAGAFVAVVDKVNGIVIVEATDVAGSHTDFSDFNDGNQQTGASVLRFTPSTTTEVETGVITVGAIASGTRRAAVFAVVRNNSSTTTFQLRLRFNSEVVGRTPQITILPFVTAAAPYWRFLGIIPVSAVMDRMVIQAKASAASGTMDIDRVVIVDVTDMTSNILALPAMSGGGPNTGTLTIDHRLLTRISPIVQHVTATTIVQPWQGSPFFHTDGATVYGILMATNRIANNKWRQESAVPALLQNTWTLNRRLAYFIPE